MGGVGCGGSNGVVTDDVAACGDGGEGGCGRVRLEMKVVVARGLGGTGGGVEIRWRREECVYKFEARVLMKMRVKPYMVSIYTRKFQNKMAGLK
ncbi:hypothetical protein Tco_0678477 [Tanacetum coccineum]|uniref:Uncharacterized protein n=1 Tax=Tanacetum coccineum TaxID=301880 RepID=A0ABQ4XF82_9ASTR